MTSGLTFSQRMGLSAVRHTIQTQEMSDSLRNSLWNALVLEAWDLYEPQRSATLLPRLRHYRTALYCDFLKQPVDRMSPYHPDLIQMIREHFFAWTWNEVYDFLEFTLAALENRDLVRLVNVVLAEELSGYRYIDGCISPITDENEMASLNEALQDNDYPGVKQHLQRALELMSDRDNPDYRNSIKESISAVESIARVITGASEATLGKALNVLEEQVPLHQALKAGFSKLYGYTSDEEGIRHSILEDGTNVGLTEAKYFLVSCAAFTNYLKMLYIDAISAQKS